MARIKKTSSKVISYAAARAAGLKSIDPMLDLGNQMTVPAFDAAIAEAQTKLATYNTLLSQVDEAKNVFEAAEADVGDMHNRMLAATAAKFGRDSNEYVQAGGTKKSDRKRAVRKEVPATLKAA